MDLKLPIAGIDQRVVDGLVLANALGVDPLVEIPVAAVMSGLSEPELNAKIREGTYPTPVQIGVRKRALHLSQVRAWNENPTPSLRRTPKPGPTSGSGMTGSQA